MNILSVLSAVPWLTTLLDVLPASGDIKEFEQISRDCFQRRRTKGSARKDVFYYLLGEDKETGSKLTELELVMDSRTAIVGGSDTTSIALGYIKLDCDTIHSLTSSSCLFYYLILHQDVYKKLQAEIDAHPEPLENGWLGQLDYLNACINEGLRLMPPVPQGLQRIVPPAGATLAGKFIPGGTLVSVSPMTVQRDARNFTHPDQFIPERWLDGSKETCNKDAWIPFSIGSYGCVGKQLALSELRHITAAVVRNFDLTFAPGFNVPNFEFSVKNDFTMTTPSVDVSLSKRS
jgi:cytochrome P450